MSLNFALSVEEILMLLGGALRHDFVCSKDAKLRKREVNTRTRMLVGTVPCTSIVSSIFKTFETKW